MNANKKKRIQKVYNRQIKNVRAAQSWVVHKSDPSGSNVQIQQNQVKMTWPKVSSTIYPGQTLRVNTGWKNTSIPDNMTITSMPHKSLI